MKGGGEGEAETLRYQVGGGSLRGVRREGMLSVAPEEDTPCSSPLPPMLPPLCRQGRAGCQEPTAGGAAERQYAMHHAHHASPPPYPLPLQTRRSWVPRSSSWRSG